MTTSKAAPKQTVLGPEWEREPRLRNIGHGEWYPVWYRDKADLVALGGGDFLATIWQPTSEHYGLSLFHMSTSEAKARVDAAIARAWRA